MKSTYTQDIEFNSAFGVFQTPIHLFTASILCGIDPPSLHKPFRFLDLACGNGFTLCFLAQVYPSAQFVGIDINPAHVQTAQRFVEKLGITNLVFMQNDIETLDSRSFEKFDYCTVSGVYSWLDAKRQQATRTCLQALVKTGGVVYLDYSCQPGMAQTSALYQVLARLSNTHQGNSAEKLGNSIKILSSVKDSGAQFFKENHIANDRFASIKDNPVSDEAHEILNIQNQSLWSGEVLSDMQNNGFKFIGHAALHHNVHDFISHRALPTEAKHLDEPSKQILLDVLNNVGRRKDLYVKQDLADETRSSSKTFDIIESLREYHVYIAPNALSPKNLTRVQRGFPNVNFAQKIYTDCAKLIQHSDTFSSLISQLKQREHSTEIIRVALQNLLASRAMSVACMANYSARAGEHYYMPLTINILVLEEDIGKEHARPFMSQVIGSRLVMTLKDRLYLWAFLGKDLSEAWLRLGDLREALRDNNGKVLSEEEFKQVILSSMPAFQSVMVPELLKIGIIEVK